MDTVQRAKVHDEYIKSYKMDPFWVTSAPFEGRHAGGSFFCFINAHYPEEFVSLDEEEYKKGLEKLASGKWRLENLQNTPDKKIGWGCDITPSRAFYKALVNAGYLKKQV